LRTAEELPSAYLWLITIPIRSWGGSLGVMSYYDELSIVIGSQGGAGHNVPSPAPGLRHLEMARIGGDAHFWLNGSHIGSLTIEPTHFRWTV
jgi:hypothetical protein